MAPVVIGFALALALNTKLRGRAVLRGLFLMPWVIPGVVVSFVWLWIFNANYGLLNGLLVQLHLVDEPIVGWAPRWRRSSWRRAGPASRGSW
ncbi:hypothetical protein [Dactylosporangium cerinum]